MAHHTLAHHHTLPQAHHTLAQVLHNLAHLFAWLFLLRSGTWRFLACHFSAWGSLFLRTSAWRFLFLRTGDVAHEQERGRDQCQFCLHVRSPCLPSWFPPEI